MHRKRKCVPHRSLKGDIVVPATQQVYRKQIQLKYEKLAEPHVDYPFSYLYEVIEPLREWGPDEAQYGDWMPNELVEMILDWSMILAASAANAAANAELKPMHIRLRKVSKRFMRLLTRPSRYQCNATKIPRLAFRYVRGVIAVHRGLHIPQEIKDKYNKPDPEVQQEFAKVIEQLVRSGQYFKKDDYRTDDEAYVEACPCRRQHKQTVPAYSCLSTQHYMLLKYHAKRICICCLNDFIYVFSTKCIDCYAECNKICCSFD